MKTRELLDQHRISYKVYTHPETFDAQHLAAALHVPGENVAKTVLLRANGGSRYFVAVLPATEQLDLHSVSTAFGGAQVRMASETEIAEHCPDVEFGVLPPFGTQFGMETIADESLSRHEDMFFQGDSHTEAIRMGYHDYCNLEHPITTNIVCTKDERG